MVCVDEVHIVVYDGVAATLSEELLASYLEVYAEAPYWETAKEVAEFAAEWPELLAEPGFRLALARTDAGELVGFALGHLLGANSAWWADMRPMPAAETTGRIRVEDLTRSFGVAELGVHRAWRRRGIARRLHDALLAGRSELPVVLWARTDAPGAQATYDRWGYQRLGTVQRGEDLSYYVLCRDHAPGR